MKRLAAETRPRGVIGAAAFVLMSLTAISVSASGKNDEFARRPLPTFALDSLTGERVSTSELDGQVVVISFWATWCAPCLQELPFLDGFYDRYHDEGLTVLAIATDGPESLARVRSTVRRGRWTMPVLLDLDGSVFAQLNPRGVQPFTVFVDRAGRIVSVREGFAVGDEVGHEALIQSLLAEPR